MRTSFRYICLVPTPLRVTRAAGAGGDEKEKGRKTFSLAFLLSITPLAPLRRDKERDDWNKSDCIWSHGENSDSVM